MSGRKKTIKEMPSGVLNAKTEPSPSTFMYHYFRSSSLLNENCLRGSLPWVIIDILATDSHPSSRFTP